MRKLKSFTIFELVVALLISSALISIGYYSVLIVLGMFKKNISQSEQITEYYLFKRALDNDFQRCDFAGTVSDRSRLLLRWEKRGDKIIYEFREDYITREMQSAVDTFHLQTMGLETDFYSDNVKLIKNILLMLRLDDKQVRNVFVKRYSSSQVLAFENQNHE